MIQLSRTVRFSLSGRAPLDRPRANTYAAWPAMRGLGRYYELHVCCEGEPDPQTGYFMNIKEIDTAVREQALPYLAELITSGNADDAPMGTVMREILARVNPVLGNSLVDLRLSLTPYYQIQMKVDDMDHVIVRNQYQFAAAHRLHVDSLSAAENKQVFGKCNNPSGHGHNYRLEVAVRCPIDSDGQTTYVERIDEVVDEHVIEALDHKHLNQDVAQFKSLNPSVENIAKVIHEMLNDKVGAIGGSLDEVTVWETDKTMCTYRGS